MVVFDNDEATAALPMILSPLRPEWDPLPLAPEMDRRSDVALCAHMLED